MSIPNICGLSGGRKSSHVPWHYRKNSTMTKRNIVRRIADELDSSEIETKLIVQKTLDTIINVLAKEGRVELRNFGVFEVKKRKPRQARNPRTGEKVMVGERSTVTFKPGRVMEERVAMECRGRSVPMRKVDAPRKKQDDDVPRRKRLKKGEKNGQKRMACVGRVYSVAPFRRTVAEVLNEILRKEKQEQRPKPQNKRLRAVLTREVDGEEVNAKDVIFDWLAQELQQRDPIPEKAPQPPVF